MCPCLNVHAVKRKRTAHINKNLNTFVVRLPWCEARLLRASMPLSPYIGDEVQMLYLCMVWLYRARKTAAEVGITEMHLLWHTMGPCVGFPIVLWWYFQLPRFILPLLNGIMISNYFTLSIQTVIQVGGSALVHSPFDNDHQKKLLCVFLPDWSWWDR